MEAVPVRRRKLTVRRLMIAVAVLAMIFGGVTHGFRLRRRSELFAMEAALHDRKVVRFTRYAVRNAEAAKSMGSLPFARTFALQADFCRILVTYHEDLGRKYRRAASRPWLRLAPDPPEPVLLPEPATPRTDPRPGQDLDLFEQADRIERE